MTERNYPYRASHARANGTVNVRRVRDDSVFLAGHRRREPARTAVAVLAVLAVALSPAVALWLGVEYGPGHAGVVVSDASR